MRGRKQNAILLKKEIGEALKKIKLRLSESKTTITHAVKGKTKFLGVVISKTGARSNQPRWITRDKGPRKRIGGGLVSMRIPEQKLIKKLIEYGFMISNDKG